jgi:hypothetical protein
MAMMAYADSIACRAIKDGLLAERKLHGDPDVFATDDREELQRIISQGRRMEGLLRDLGKANWIKAAYERAGRVYVEPA